MPDDLSEPANSARRAQFDRLPDRVMVCAVCKRGSLHRHDGYQKLPRYTLVLWTSRCCEATRSERLED